MTQSLTDVDGLIGEAFEEMECIWNDESPHEGNKAAYVEYHDCVEGFWCAFHLRRFINEHLPLIKMAIGTPAGKCQVCRKHFFDVESYVKVYPL